MGFVLEEPVKVTRRVQVVGVLVLVLVVAVAVVIWRASRPNLDPGTEAVTVAGVTVLRYTEDYEGVFSAMARTGRLRVLDGDCLGLEGGTLVVLPRGAEVAVVDGEVAVRTPDGALLRAGDEVQLGGHVLSDTPVADFGGGLAAHVPAACRGYGAVAADGGLFRG